MIVGDAAACAILSVGVVVGAVAVAVSSEAFGVNVVVLVGALILVGVGVRLNARDVDVRNTIPAVWVIWAIWVLCWSAVVVGDGNGNAEVGAEDVCVETLEVPDPTVDVTRPDGVFVQARVGT